jgi:hypothetical protein
MASQQGPLIGGQDFLDKADMILFVHTEMLI